MCKRKNDKFCPGVIQALFKGNEIELCPAVFQWWRGLQFGKKQVKI